MTSFEFLPGPSAPWPGALEDARKKEPGHSGRDDSEEEPKIGRETQEEEKPKRKRNPR
jgi:hypothetical protein